jgi:hypothetical protein
MEYKKKSSNQIIQEKWSALEVLSSKRSFGVNATADGGQDSGNSNLAQSPNLDSLKKKFLQLDDNANTLSDMSGSGKSSGTTQKKESISSLQDELNADDDTEVKLVKPKSDGGSDSNTENNSKERTIIISKNEGLKGAQG